MKNIYLYLKTMNFYFLQLAFYDQKMKTSSKYINSMIVYLN